MRWILMSGFSDVNAQFRKAAFYYLKLIYHRLKESLPENTKVGGCVGPGGWVGDVLLDTCKLILGSGSKLKLQGA